MLRTRYLLILIILTSTVSDAAKPTKAPEPPKQCKCHKGKNYINCNSEATSTDVCWHCQNEKNCGKMATELWLDPNENLTSSKYVIEQCCGKINIIVLKDVRKCGEFCSEEWVTKTKSGLPCSCKLTPRTRPKSDSTTPSSSQKAFTMVLEVSVVLFSLPCLVMSALLAYCYKKGRSVEIPIKEMITQRKNTENAAKAAVRDDPYDDRMIDDVIETSQRSERGDKLIQIVDESESPRLMFENPSFVENEPQSSSMGARLVDI